MKVLVATARTQGTRSNDYHHCTEGELVWIGLVCSADRADPDGGCGCGRGFGGLNSHRVTTTAQVVELAMSGADHVEAFRSSLEQQGWGAELGEEIAGDMAELVADLPVGTVVERRLDDVVIRALPASR
ncbi:hypothetical protein ACLFMI_13160 [Pseudonocardia nantongensis]|uniref:DUF7715 family protein n=1 Tax=Pseudonocardia nantongensis TaxID=1181885 RepID=UPI00397CF6DD